MLSSAGKGYGSGASEQLQTIVTTGLERTTRQMHPLTRISQRRGVRQLVELDRRALSWRAAAGNAELAFRSWGRAATKDRDAAAARYLAAIDREERAAQEYRDAVHACDGRRRIVFR